MLYTFCSDCSTLFCEQIAPDWARVCRPSEHHPQKDHQQSTSILCSVIWMPLFPSEQYWRHEACTWANFYVCQPISAFRIFVAVIACATVRHKMKINHCVTDKIIFQQGGLLHNIVRFIALVLWSTVTCKTIHISYSLAQSDIYHYTTETAHVPSQI